MISDVDMNLKGCSFSGLLACLCFLSLSVLAQDNPADTAPESGQQQSADTTESVDQSTEQPVAESDDQSVGDSDDAPVDESADESVTDEVRRVRRLGDSTSNEGWSLGIPSDLRVRAPEVDVPVITTPDTALNDRLLAVMTVMASNPEDADSLAALEDIKQTVDSRISEAITAGDLNAAASYIGVMQELQADRPELESYREQLGQLRELRDLNTRFADAIADQRLLGAEDNSARSILREIQSLAESSPVAATTVANSTDTLQQVLQQQFAESLDEQNFDQAANWLDGMAGLPGEPDINEQRQLLQQRKQNALNQFILAVDDNIATGNLATAEQQLNELIALGAAPEQITPLRARLGDARVYGSFVPGQVFRDSFGQDTGEGPPMTVLPAGNFMMGSQESEPGHRSNEAPYHRVTFARGFALSQREISVGEFRVFVRSTAYRTTAEREGSSAVYNEETGRMSNANIDWRNAYDGRSASDDMPVMHISWEDASAYVEWLSRVTSRSYRLPSEAELEYAIRGGTQTIYWWGDGSPASNEVENIAGEGDATSNRRRWNDSFEEYRDGYWGPAPVGNLQPNLYGLYDINGNLKEWAEDCWHVNYNRAPDDGSAWVNQGCASRVVRGADWSSTPDLSRSALRLSARETTRGVRVGIRVARDL